ncbi:chorion protein S18 [Drosophila bipectinata]|uniref:chorion protein S18 n=1 Tax=Drosophila bipectinata TaxID=42026 RepID=UPI001C8A88DF|nr:chorion protein S18 [Drosophila bipectinata]
MMKFMCICICAIAAASASPYGGNRGGYGGAPVGGYAYQVQPALTVKAIIPSYGGGYGGNQGGYGGSYESAPLASAYSGANVGSGYSGSGYGGAPPVDRQAIALAKLALAAPSAGQPLLWKEAPRYVQREYAPSVYNHKQEYGHGDEAQGASAAAASSSVAAGKKGYKKHGY